MSATAAGADPGTVHEQGEHRPDIVPDSAADAVRTASLPSRDVDAVAAALLSSVPFMEVLVTALDRHQEQRDAVTRRPSTGLAAGAYQSHQ
jgi:hypothetical protein